MIVVPVSAGTVCKGARFRLFTCRCNASRAQLLKRLGQFARCELLPSLLFISRTHLDPSIAQLVLEPSTALVMCLVGILSSGFDYGVFRHSDHCYAAHVDRICASRVDLDCLKLGGIEQSLITSTSDKQGHGSCQSGDFSRPTSWILALA